MSADITTRTPDQRDEEGESRIDYKATFKTSEYDGVAQTADHSYQQPRQTGLGLGKEIVVTLNIAGET